MNQAGDGVKGLGVDLLQLVLKRMTCFSTLSNVTVVVSMEHSILLFFFQLCTSWAPLREDYQGTLGRKLTTPSWNNSHLFLGSCNLSFYNS